MPIGFTGTSKRFPTVEQGKRLNYRLKVLYAGGEREFHHGDCIKMDAWVAEAAKAIGFRLICHPPANEYKRAFVQSHVVSDRKPFLDRNHDIVDESTILLAAPDTSQEELRSGTWATIRYARKKKIPVEIYV